MSSCEIQKASGVENPTPTPWKFAKLSDEEYDIFVMVSCKAGLNMTKLPEHMLKLMSEFNRMADTLSSYEVMHGLFRTVEMSQGGTSLDIREDMYDKIKDNIGNTMFTVRTRSDMKTLLRMADKLSEINQLNWAIATGNYDEIRRLVK